MRHLSLLLVCLIAVACVRDRTTPVTAAYQQQANDIELQAVSRLFAPECRRPYRVTPGNGLMYGPSMHVLHNKAGQQVRQGCGMVAAGMENPEARARFVESACHGMDDARCSEIMSKAFFARMGERYAHVNWSAVGRKCDAYPDQCANWDAVERWVITSHNEGVWEIARQMQADASVQYAIDRAQAEQAEREDKRAIGRALQGMSDGMKPKPTVNCTSTGYGNTVQTTCR